MQKIYQPCLILYYYILLILDVYVSKGYVIVFQNLQIVPPQLIANTHDLLTSIETIYSEGQLLGSPDRFFGIIDRCISKRPESSVLALVMYKSQSCQPECNNWMSNLAELLDKYYR